MVWFHGGGLEGGQKHIPQEFLRQGYAVATVNYRLSPRAHNPAYTEDAAEAVAWVFEHIAEYGGDTAKIYIAGHSAGGYLCLMLNLDNVIWGNGALMPTAWPGLSPSAGKPLPITPSARNAVCRRTCRSLMNMPPSNQVRKDASPMILITGDKDLEMLARYEENAHLYALLKALGQPSVLFQLEGFDHNTVLSPACLLINRYLKKGAWWQRAR